MTNQYFMNVVLKKLEDVIEETYKSFEIEFGTVPKSVQDYGYGLVKCLIEERAERQISDKSAEEMLEEFFSK